MMASNHSRQQHRQLTQRASLLVMVALMALTISNVAHGAERPFAGEGDGDAFRPAARVPLPLRLRRQAHKLSVGQLAALSAQAAEQQAPAGEQSLAETDEQTLKRQLPDLIAQAHNDKSLERALLRLVISASLRNSNLMSPSMGNAQQLAGGGAAAATSGNQWQLDSQQEPGNGLGAYNQAGELALVNQRSANRLDPAELVYLESQLAGELPELLAGAGPTSGQLGAPMDKREYTKPCSFNAISCVRPPSRTLK